MTALPKYALIALLICGCAHTHGQDKPTVVLADKQIGVDACEKIRVAEASLSSSGGIVDARGFQGVQICGGTFTVGTRTQSIQLLLGNIVLIVQKTVGLFQGSEIKGVGANGTSESVIQSGASFPPSTVLLQYQTKPVGDAIRVRDIQLNLQRAPGSIGVDFGASEDQTDMRNVLVLNWVGSCIRATNADVEQVMIDSVTCMGSSTTGPDTIGVDLGDSPGLNDNLTLNNVGVTTMSKTKMLAAIRCNSCNVYGNSIHIEQSVDGILLTGGRSGAAVLDSISGLINVTNVVHVDSSWNGSVSIRGVRKLGAAIAIKDSLSSKNCTAESVGMFELSFSVPHVISVDTNCAFLAPP